MLSRCFRSFTGFSGGPCLALLMLLLAPLPVLAAPRVAVSVKPLQHVLAALMDGVGEAALVLDGSQDPHNIALRPSERRLLAEAELVVWIGPALELPLQKVLRQLDAEVLGAQQLPGMTLIGEGQRTDPHLWLDSDNVRVLAGALTRELLRLDAANAARYRENLRSFEALLERSDAEISALFGARAPRLWAVYHQSFQYFETRFGLAPPLILKDSDNNEPGLRTVLAFRDAMRGRGLHCILVEPGTNARELRELLDDEALEVRSVDILGYDLAVNARSYASLLLGVARAIHECSLAAEEGVSND